MNYPLPDCAVRPTDCEDLVMVNSLDGWGLQPRVSIPFTGDVDPATLNSDTVFLLDVPEGRRIGTTQLIWDPATHTLHGESDEVLDQHHRYAVIVTDGVRDTSGNPVKAMSDFHSMDANHAPAWYQARLKEVFMSPDCRDSEERHHCRERLHDSERHVRDGAHSRLDQGEHPAASRLPAGSFGRAHRVPA